MDGCLFCKIAAREIKSYSIYEDEHVLVFLDIHSRAPGHTMVIPKTHAANLLELPDEEVAPLFLAVKKVSKLLEDRLKPDGFTVGINQGRASGQEVDHLHVHIMPRWKNDGGNAVQSLVNNQSMGSVEEIHKKIVG